MESSVVLFKPRIHLFACTHPSVSNSLDCNDWLAYKHQSTARVQTHLDCGSSLKTSTSFHPVFQTYLDCGSLFAHTHQYPALCSNTFGLRFCVCVQTSVDSPLTKHVWNVDPCLRTRICFQHRGSNTYGLWFRVWVQASASCLLGHTRLDFGLHPCLKHVLIMVLVCVRISLQPCVSNVFGLLIPVCAHASVSSLVQTRLIMVACLFTSISVLSQKATEMSGVPCCGNGDGHKHGCLDALAISLSSVSMYKHLDFQLVIKRFKVAGLYSAEDLATAGRGNILPESVIGQLLPADADEASREALNVIFDVGRQALPGSMRLCLRQLRNKQGISEVQTGMASSSLLYPVDLSNTLATQASRLLNRLSRSLVGSKGQVFSNAHPVDFSLQSKRSSEFTWAVERCFLFLEELGTQCLRYNLCFSAPFPARETDRQLQAAAFQSSFSADAEMC